MKSNSYSQAFYLKLLMYKVDFSRVYFFDFFLSENDSVSFVRRKYIEKVFKQMKCECYHQ